jgi:hypothetical protein
MFRVLMLELPVMNLEMEDMKLAELATSFLPKASLNGKTVSLQGY